MIIYCWKERNFTYIVQQIKKRISQSWLKFQSYLHSLIVRICSFQFDWLDFPFAFHIFHPTLHLFPDCRDFQETSPLLYFCPSQCTQWLECDIMISSRRRVSRHFSSSFGTSCFLRLKCTMYSPPHSLFALENYTLIFRVFTFCIRKEEIVARCRSNGKRIP